MCIYHFCTKIVFAEKPDRYTRISQHDYGSNRFQFHGTTRVQNVFWGRPEFVLNSKFVNRVYVMYANELKYENVTYFD